MGRHFCVPIVADTVTSCSHSVVATVMARWEFLPCLVIFVLKFSQNIPLKMNLLCLIKIFIQVQANAGLNPCVGFPFSGFIHV